MAKLVLIDTNVLMSFIEFIESVSYFSKILHDFKYIKIGVPSLCVEEAKQILKIDGCTNDEISQKITDVKNLLKFEIINLKDDDEKEGRYLFNKYKHITDNNKKPKLHKPDQDILALAKRKKAWRLYTTDNNFLEIIRSEGINGKKFPTQDTIIDLKLRKKY